MTISIWYGALYVTIIFGFPWFESECCKFCQYVFPIILHKIGNWIDKRFPILILVEKQNLTNQNLTNQADHSTCNLLSITIGAITSWDKARGSIHQILSLKVKPSVYYYWKSHKRWIIWAPTEECWTWQKHILHTTDFEGFQFVTAAYIQVMP